MKSKKQSPFVKSNFPRVPNDHYPTIDSRCVDALLDSGIGFFNYVWDCCSINGSGILDRLRYHKRKVYKGKNAYTPNPFPGKRIDWIVSNPPFDRGVVDKIIAFQVARLNTGQVSGVAMLLRTSFDHAKKYQYLFRDCPHYAGQLKLTFRPVWFEESTASPIHNYVWHFWKLNTDPPVVLYSK
jgi:hypothetical protein